MKWTSCECDEPGWCSRHRCFKLNYQFVQCQTRQEVFDQWERGGGPCLNRDVTQLNRSGPSLTQRAVNLGVAVVRHVANGLQQVDQMVYDSRLDVCRACASCDTGRMVCLQPSCGCSLAIKAWWASEKCPLNHWPEGSSPIGDPPQVDLVIADPPTS